ncbi:MAG TPA: hypothetical protein VHE80_06945 [Acidimicrobiales bacterium]|nr:hypothetical protein [Acidimicrobiales bacterium]
MRRTILAAALALAVPVIPAVAEAQEPQPVPEQACNEGTMDARANAPEPADSAIPHERRTGECHHLVPSGG